MRDQSQRVTIVTIGLMLGLFMSSMEVTVVSTAMPTIVAELGGLAMYSWVFAAYMVTSTTTIPIFGKLSDLYGRRPVYAAALLLFLVGSLLCGQAKSMTQLVIFRAIQGLGAGGVMPLTFTMIGAMFTLEQRAKMQGVTSSIWGLSSVVGPLLGGFLVDQVSWPWVFYVNVAPGILALLLIWYGWQEEHHHTKTTVVIDYWGALLLTAVIVLLLLGLMDIESPLGWGLLAVMVLLGVLLIWVELRVPEPVLPLGLFRVRMYAIACLHGLLAGAAMFGCISYVPLFIQVAFGASATEAGAALTPMIFGWVLASVIGGRLLLRIGYLSLVLSGGVALALGALLMSQMGAHASQLFVLSSLTLMGVGMGLAIPAFLIVVQSTVPRQVLGAATSTLQFTRTVGGTIGVSIMGVALSQGLATQLSAAGLDPAKVSVETLLEQVSNTTTVSSSLEAARTALTAATQNIFVVAVIFAALALIAVWFTPRRIPLHTVGHATPKLQAEPLELG